MHLNPPLITRSVSILIHTQIIGTVSPRDTFISKIYGFSGLHGMSSFKRIFSVSSHINYIGKNYNTSIYLKHLSAPNHTPQSSSPLAELICKWSHFLKQMHLYMENWLHSEVILFISKMTKIGKSPKKYKRDLSFTSLKWQFKDFWVPVPSDSFHVTSPPT